MWRRVQVETLDEVSARAGLGKRGRRGPRCFLKAMLCQPHNWWRPSPTLRRGQAWWTGLQPFTLGQQVGSSACTDSAPHVRARERERDSDNIQYLMGEREREGEGDNAGVLPGACAG